MKVSCSVFGDKTACKSETDCDTGEMLSGHLYQVVTQLQDYQLSYLTLILASTLAYASTLYVFNLRSYLLNATQCSSYPDLIFCC